MKRNRKWRWIFAVSVLLAGVTTTFQNCGPTSIDPMAGDNTTVTPLVQPSAISTGPIDGNYALAAWSCGSIDLMNVAQTFLHTTSTTLKITGTMGLETMNDGGCMVAQSWGYTFINSSMVTIQTGGKTCTACAASFCQTAPAPIPAVTMSANYTYTGSSVRFTRALTSIEVANQLTVYHAAGCQAGDQELKVYLK